MLEVLYGPAVRRAASGAAEQPLLPADGCWARCARCAACSGVSCTSWLVLFSASSSDRYGGPVWTLISRGCILRSSRTWRCGGSAPVLIVYHCTAVEPRSPVAALLCSRRRHDDSCTGRLGAAAAAPPAAAPKSSAAQADTAEAAQSAAAQQSRWRREKSEATRMTTALLSFANVMLCS